MNEAVHAAAGVPPWVRDVQHACPRCRTAIELSEGGASCPSCGFRVATDRGVYRFVAQAGAVQYWQDTYDAMATGALPDTGPGLLYRSPVQQRVAAFRHLCGDITAASRILDVGCADGTFWEALLDRRPAIGVDFSLEMCVLARARGMIAYQADALALPFADNQFDLVYCAGLLEHIADLPTLFAELARICRPGGRVVVSTGNKLSLARQVMHLVRRMKPHPVILRREIIMRTIGELAAAALGQSLAPDQVCWTYFPLPWQRRSKSTRNLLS